MEPPQYDHQRVDSDGLEGFFAQVHAFVEDDFGQTVGAHADQGSMLFGQGIHMTGFGTGESAPPAGSSTGSSHVYFAVEFMVDRDMAVPLLMSVDGGEDHSGSFHFTGPGVDIHLVAWDDPSVFYEGFVPLVGNQSYWMSIEGWSGIWADNARVDCYLDFWVPSPGTMAVWCIAPAICRRRR